MTVKIKIKYFKDDAPRLTKIQEGSWIDLYLDKDINLIAGQREYLPMGVAMKLPEGYEAIMSPRSSTFKRWGLLQTNSIGVLDNSFNTDTCQWMFPVLATKDVFIPRGTRICQFRIQKEQPEIIFEEVDTLGEGMREAGLGSTGL